MPAYGIRIRRGPGDAFQRGKQFRRAPESASGWVEWRDEWPSRRAALLRLARYRLAGWRGHVFQIHEPSPPVTYPTATHYSPNFTRAELECRGPECDGVSPGAAIERNLTELATHLELLRHQLGGSVGIGSGHRCPIHNRRVHGASLSRHMMGDAADLAVPPGQQSMYVAAAKQVPAFRKGGIGVYPHGGVHVDHRGYVARWDSWVRS